MMRAKMDGNWYYIRAGQQIGPVTRAVVEQMVAAGQISADDLVWTEGLPQWQPAGQVFDIRSQQQFIPYANPTQYYYNFEYATFGRRLVAYLLDFLIAGLISAMINVPIYLIHPSTNDVLGQDVIGTLIGWLYMALFESSKFQATPGKMAGHLCDGCLWAEDFILARNRTAFRDDSVGADFVHWVFDDRLDPEEAGVA